MNPRYFNLKINRPNMWGSIIKLTPDADLEHRLESFSHDRQDIESEKFKFLARDSKWAIYEATIPAVRLTQTGETNYLATGKPTKLKLRTAGTKLELYKTNGRKFYLQEVSEEEAKTQRAQTTEWCALHHY